MISAYVGERGGTSYFLEVENGKLVLLSLEIPRYIGDLGVKNPTKAYIFAKDDVGYKLEDHEIEFIYNGSEFYLNPIDIKSFYYSDSNYVKYDTVKKVKKGKYYLYAFSCYVVMEGNSIPLTNADVTIKENDAFIVKDANYSDTNDEEGYKRSFFLKEIEFLKNGEYEIEITIRGIKSIVNVEVSD